MPSRKRTIQSADGDGGDEGSALLHRIRNTWQFANLCQWIYMFGKAAKIDDSIDVDDIEAECLKPNSTLLSDLALAILKLVSSHRGLTHDIFDDQVRKQYLAKSPDNNPFGNDDNPHKFADFDVFTKIKVLQQLTQWTMIHPERIRDKVEEQKDTEQASWRIEPYGWDREDRTYFVLDDNRVYRLTEPPSVSPRPKPKKGKSRGGRRSSKRQRTMPSTGVPTADIEAEWDGEVEPVDDGLGGRTWECIAVSLQEVRDFLGSLGKTRDDNEKILRRQLETHLVPILEKQEESEKRKQAQRERELLNLAKMANAKRSSRIAGKIERQKQEVQEKEEEIQRRENEAAKRREEQKLLKLEKERDFRLFSRQRRLQEREARRLQHEEELAHLSEDSKAASSTAGRVSERRLQAEIERNRQALRDLEEEEEDWAFDCVCGLYGQVDDGAHSVACEKCNVWQHSKCLGVSEEDADRPEFHFVCGHCKNRDQVAKAPPRSAIKLKLNPTGSSAAHHRQADERPLLPSIKTSTSSNGTSALPTQQDQLATQAPFTESSPAHSVPLVAQNMSPMSTLPPSIACAPRESTCQPVHLATILQNGNAGTSRTAESQQGQLLLTEAAFRGSDPSSKDHGTHDDATKMTGTVLAAVSPVTNAGANVDSERQSNDNGTFVDPNPDSSQATFNVQRAPSFAKVLLPGSNVPYPTNTAHDTNGPALIAKASSTPAEQSTTVKSPPPHEQAAIAHVGSSSAVRDDFQRK